MDTEAWLLHRYTIKSTSSRLILFTPHHGKLEGFYRHRSLINCSPVSLFRPLWCLFDERKGHCYIKKIEPVGGGLSFQKLSLFAALYINELLFYALQPDDPYSNLYVQYMNALKKLARCSDRLSLERILRGFEWHLLLANGCPLVAPSINPIFYYEFDPDDGFKKANTGIIGAHILSIVAGDFTEPSLLKSAKYVMRKAIAHLLDYKELRSRQLFLGEV